MLPLSRPERRRRENGEQIEQEAGNGCAQKDYMYFAAGYYFI
jgi:hypothetical protein